MKKEILRINNLSLEYSNAVKLTNISMCLLAGECAGFLGLENSGKNLLVGLICGNYGNCHVDFYIDGKRLTSMEDLQKNVYKINVSNYIINDWTVAEYIFLVEDHSRFGILNRKKLIVKAEKLFQRFGLNIDVSKKLKRLTELEKRLMDLIKAYSKNVKILVVEDEFEGCSTEDIKQFKELLNLITQEDIAVIINSHSDNVSRILSDKYIIFDKGFLVKKVTKKFTNDNCSFEDYLLSTSAISKSNVGNNDNEKIINPAEIVYIVNNIYQKGKDEINLVFSKSEVVTILSLDVKIKERIFELLSGRSIDKYLTIILNEKQCNFNDISDFVGSKIASIADMGGESELLLSMSAGSNLLLPSLEKISSLQHVLMEHRVVKMLEKEVKENRAGNHDNIKDLSVNECIMILLERWYIYKPKVLVLLEPFVHCDIYGVSLVKSYIKKFTDLGTTVIIVQSREEYVDDISDRIIKIE